MFATKIQASDIAFGGIAMTEMELSQSDKFKKMARKLESHDDNEGLKERLQKIVKQKPADKAE